MTQRDFSHFLEGVRQLSPEQLAALRRELDATMLPAEGLAVPVVPPGEAVKPVWEEILELTAGIPDAEWEKLPVDGAAQHDHYIYGTPKKPPAR